MTGKTEESDRIAKKTKEDYKEAKKGKDRLQDGQGRKK